MSRLTSARSGVATAGMSAKNYKGNKPWRDGAPLIVVKPIRSIGRFFEYLEPKDQQYALRLAKAAGSLPKHFLDSEYARLERIAYAPKN